MKKGLYIPHLCTLESKMVWLAFLVFFWVWGGKGEIYSLIRSTVTVDSEKKGKKPSFSFSFLFTIVIGLTNTLPYLTLTLP